MCGTARHDEGHGEGRNEVVRVRCSDTVRVRHSESHNVVRVRCGGLAVPWCCAMRWVVDLCCVFVS